MDNMDQPSYNDPGPSSYPYPQQARHPAYTYGSQTHAYYPSSFSQAPLNGRNSPNIHGAHMSDVFPNFHHHNLPARGGGSAAHSLMYPPQPHLPPASQYHYVPQSNDPATTSYGPHHAGTLHNHLASEPPPSSGLPQQTASPRSGNPQLRRGAPSPRAEPLHECVDMSHPGHVPPKLPAAQSFTTALPRLEYMSHSRSSSASDTHQPTEPPPHQSWIISPFRPENPMDAFNIIISPLANPPPHVIAGAADAPPAPPAKMPNTATKPTLKSAAARQVAEMANATQSNQQPTTSPAAEVAHTYSSSVNNPSTKPVRSTATSLSAPTAKATSSSEVDPVAPSMSITLPPNLPKSVVAEMTQTTEPIAPAPAPVTKSWASLLRPANGASSKAANTLPTSPIVGFSIPADQVGSVDLPPVSPSKKPGLLALLATGPTVNARIPQIRPRGLVNTGNMCFANAVLQVLVYCPPFYNLFGELGKYITGPVVGNRGDKWTPLVDAAVEFLKEFKPTPRSRERGDYEDDELDSFLPTYVYDALKEKKRFDNMRGGHQEDAEEFLGFFLDTLEEELLSLQTSLGADTKPSASIPSGEIQDGTPRKDDWVEVGKRNKLVVTRASKSVESPITHIFGGKFRSTLKVPGQRDSVMVEDWRALQLEIQREQIKSIEDALRCISLPQPVQVSSVTKGGAIVDAVQHVLVQSLPPILVLHLKRFLYDTTANGVVKIGKQIEFGPELEFPADAMSPPRRLNQPIKYKLFAVVYHHGQSAAGGHYTLDVLHPNRNADLTVKPREGWIRIDDELVSDLRIEDVFRDELDGRCAYLLFYKRFGGAHLRT